MLLLCVSVTIPWSLFAALSWTTKTSMPTERYDMCTGTVQDVIYVIGGDPGSLVPISTVEAYDPTADTVGGVPWTAKQNMPYNMHRLAAAVIDGKIYTCGGWYGMGAKPYTLEYDPGSDSWTQKTDMPAARLYHAAASFNGKMYAFGGRYTYNTAFEYDPAGDSWATKTPMPTGRYEHAAVTANGKIYVIGGQDGTSIFSTVEEYDPGTDSWTTKSSMPTARTGITACLVRDTIYVIGGRDNTKAYLNTVEKYDPATDNWTQDTPMPTARRAPISAVVNGIIYVIGGDNGNELDVNEAAEPATSIGLTSINAVGERGGVKISWSTAGETGIIRWIIQRAVHGSYQTIAILDAKGESPVPNSYCYFDSTALAETRNLYKVGAQNRDNGIRWFGPVSAIPFTNAAGPLSITPNPFTTEVRIELLEIREYLMESTVRIFDVSGRRVRVVPLLPTGASLAATWDGRNNAGKAVPPGTYFIKLVDAANNVAAIKKVTRIK